MSRKFSSNNTELIIDYTLEGTEWEAALDKTRRTLANDVTIPGFRKGKAPLSEALKHISLSRIFDKTISDNLDKIYRNHITTQINDNDLLADNFRPKFDVVELTLDKAVFEFVFPLFPEIKLGDYKNIKTKLDSIELSESELTEARNAALNNYVVNLESNEPIKLNDSVNFNFTGYIDGEKFDGGESENFELVIGSNQFIPGFEDQMIGLVKNEEKDLNLKFPENYHAKNLAGKDVVFKVKINSIKTPNYPEINDQFLNEVKINPLVTNKESFDKFIKITALRDKINSIMSKFTEDAINEIILDSSIKMSDLIISQTADSYYRDFIQQLKQKGITEKDYIEFAKTSKDEILDLYKSEAIKNLNKSYVYGKIVDEEKLHTTQEEYEERINSLATLYGIQADQVKTFLTFERFEQERLATKIFNKLAELNDKEALDKLNAANEEVSAYNKEAEEILVKEAKEKSAQAQAKKEEANKEKEAEKQK